VARAGLGKPVKRQGAELIWHCPRPAAHEHGDANPSLMINPKKDVFLCGPCGARGKGWALAAFLAGVDASDKESVKSWLEKYGLRNGARREARPKRGPCVAEYRYPDSVTGGLLLLKRRYEPGADGRPKDFEWFHLEDGEWRPGYGGKKPGLYRHADIKDSAWAVDTEGERDTDAGAKIGLPTCTSGGTGSFDKQHAECLRSKRVVIIADGDEAGRTHAQKVAAMLYGKAASVKVSEIPGAKDLAEAIEQGWTREQLLALFAETGEWKPANGSEILEPEPANVGGELRPTITVKPGESPKAVDEAEEILLTHSERLGIFQRSGEVVKVVRLSESKHSCGLQREMGTVQLAPVGQIALTETFDRLMVWERLHVAKDGAEFISRIDCPGKIAKAYLSRIGSWRLPLLVGVISAPIMRTDGTILCRAGYDQATRLYLTENWPDPDPDPTRDDAIRALEFLRKPFAEFPFVAGEDETVLLAAIITALQRRLLLSAPLFAFKAPSQRTGKTLLAESTAVIATGRPAPAMAVSGDREEIRKAVAAALREGHVIVNLDNIEHPLGSPDLSRAITQPEYQDRLLGETKMLRLPTNVLWTATGNNLAFRGDLAVRTLVCRLDARLERPEERSFKIADLKGYLSEHRRELVMAALAILRAYVLAREPDQRLKPWGGFDDWSRTIRAALVWIGMADPCATRQHVIEDDPDREQAAALLSAWHSVVGSDAVQIAHMVNMAAKTTELNAALLGVAAARNDGSHIDPRRLSWWCREWRDKVVGGLVLAKSKDYRKSATWQVKAPDRSDCGVSGVSGIKNPSTKTTAEPIGPAPESIDQIFRGGNDPIDPTNPKLDETIFTNPAKPAPSKAGYTEGVL
jgi:hypothetical protein